MKTEVYSWRLSPELKSDLEREARHRKTSVSALLEVAVREWLSQGKRQVDDDEQKGLHQAAARFVGTLDGGDPYRAENASQAIEKSLKHRYGR